MQRPTAFRSSGTDDEVERKGGEFFRILKYYSNKCLLVVAIFFSILCGCLPLIMNVFLGDFMNTMNANENFMDGLITVIYRMTGFCCASSRISRSR